MQDYIGNTPPVTLQRLSAAINNPISLKIERYNPAESIRYRPAYSMIRHAEAQAEIKPGDVLVEAAIGNSGIVLAMVAVIHDRGDSYLITGGFSSQ